MRICLSVRVNALVERSRSGRDAHVWIFFSEAIQTAKVQSPFALKNNNVTCPMLNVQ